MLAVDLITSHEDSLNLSLSDIDKHIRALDSPDDTGQNLIFLFGKLLDGNVPLDLLESLHNNLFRGLRRNPPEVLGRNLFGQNVSDFRGFLDFPRLLESNFAVGVGDFLYIRLDSIDLNGILFGIQLDRNSRRGTEILFISKDERALQRLDESLLPDALFPLEVLKSQKEILINHNNLRYKCTLLTARPKNRA